MEILQIIWPSKDLSGTRYRDKLKASSPSRKSKSCHICVHCASGQWPPPDATVLCGSCISHCSSGWYALCLWGISPSDFASFAHHFASFPHQICFISPKNCFISPTSCFISPTDCFISPTKFSLPHHYFASLCQKLEHNFLIFFPCFSSLELNFEQFFFRELLINLPCHRLSKWYNPQALVLVQTS